MKYRSICRDCYNMTEATIRPVSCFKCDSKDIVHEENSVQEPETQKAELNAPVYMTGLVYEVPNKPCYDEMHIPNPQTPEVKEFGDEWRCNSCKSRFHAYFSGYGMPCVYCDSPYTTRMKDFWTIEEKPTLASGSKAPEPIQGIHSGFGTRVMSGVISI